MTTAVLHGAAAFALPERFRQLPRLAAFALLPWLMLLAVNHETPWVVLDLAEFAALLSLDALLRRRSAAAPWLGGAVALLLAGDALADTACAGPGHAVLAALVMACCVELPLAAVCVLLGREAIRG
ncbi:hypothetical protein ACIG0C_20470 [Kitasatospora aureofaciens]|uniref:Uncharacterized protein n=1 Tax=Kitasatospora aureofaciens TaxID=1894 RepID=A0A1E7MYR6_KITAU|nr:hypothetical protein [Kitasatospora aureofaciens]QEV01729.1 hypothetical protein CP971_23025 [Streptomyces viridifaciens]ARF80486.1 hypothetical protein B6264_17615 [Kitasatospora aureofaciens]OEV33383.1 hypothetical protein HS99_0012390 [Kitasatospora aureofaciens]UKZ08165.1 hypothetical protein BOQ63_029920 [Streptomyces viridifaciens]GGU59466.1 hypothetical protein GCM10010502_07270 [Kitasatospora aureofaciens]